MQLTDSQINFFKENGYLHLKKVFSNKECQEAIDASEKFANGFYTNYLDMHKSEVFSKIHTGKKMCDIGDSILKNRAIPIGSIFFFCKPGNNLENGSTWHQDNYAGKAPFGSYLNLALVLDDADEENGSLMIIPGSHKLGDLPCNPKANFAVDESGRLYNSSPVGNNCEIPKDLPVLQLKYEKGDVLCVHGHLIHKADKNQHLTRWRRVMYFVYNNDGDPFWPGWTAKRELLDRYDSPNSSKIV